MNDLATALHLLIPKPLQPRLPDGLPQEPTASGTSAAAGPQIEVYLDLESNEGRIARSATAAFRELAMALEVADMLRLAAFQQNPTAWMVDLGQALIELQEALLASRATAAEALAVDAVERKALDRAAIQALMCAIEGYQRHSELAAGAERSESVFRQAMLDAGASSTEAEVLARSREGKSRTEAKVHREAATGPITVNRAFNGEALHVAVNIVLASLTALDAGDWRRARDGKPTLLFNNT